MLSSITDLIDDWRRSGIPVNPGASPTDVAALENFAGFPLPEDVRAFFSAANGMVDFEMDARGVSFWSIERILSDPDARAPLAGVRLPVLTFADFLVNSWFFYLEHEPTGLVVVRSGVNPEFRAEGFSDFLLRYLRNSPELCVLDPS